MLLLLQSRSATMSRASCMVVSALADRGSFAEYVKADSDLVWVVPEGTVSHEEAATLNCGQSVSYPLSRAASDFPRIFFTASVGLYAIQLAHLSGYKVATVASPRNHALLKDLGADLVLDYKTPDAPEQIKAATQSSIHVGLDMSEGSSQIFCMRLFGTARGPVTLLFTALGRAFTLDTNVVTHFPASLPDREHMAAFIKKQAALVQDGRIRPNPVKFWEGGLEAIPQGFLYMGREG
ncbi:NAD(P)-binding protein [Ramaria rubella]|nr:NAD(P)-binding protein [Ramaria rubella]